MSGHGSHLEWFRGAPEYAHVPKEIRSAGTRGFALLRLQQPPGSYRRPAGGEFTLQLSTAFTTPAQVDHGVRFSGLGDDLALSPTGIDLTYEVNDAALFLMAVMPRASVEASLSDALGRPWSGDFGRLHACVFKDAAVEALLARLWDEAAAGSPMGALFADRAWDTIALALLSATGEALPARQARPGGLAPWQVRRVRDYLEANLAEDVTLETLARLVGLSPYHLCRAFKASTGLPPHRWRMARRIERARETLERTDLALSDIAAACGFASQQHFTTAFKNHVGATPSAYRRERRS